MARDAITITALSLNTALADVAGDTIDATNDAKLTPAQPLGRILLRISHTDSGTNTVTVKAGDMPPATSATDLTVSFGDGSSVPVVKYLVLSSDRYLQSDGTVEIDYSSSFAGTIAAFALPQGA